MFSLKHNLARLSLLGVASAALIGAAAVPGQAAASGIVEVAVDAGVPTVIYRAGSQASNSASLTTFNRDGVPHIAVFDTVALTAGAGCQQLSPRAVTCGPAAGTAIKRFVANLGDRNDVFSVGAIFTGIVNGGDGDDSFLAGVKNAQRTAIIWNGGDGNFDKISYRGSDAAVRVSLENGSDGLEDGRTGDRNSVVGVEELTGSPFGDDLRGDRRDNRIDDGFVQGAGDNSGDRLSGGDGDDLLFTKDLLADQAADCGDGTGDQIFIDRTLDPAPVNCEEIVRQ
ncbi:hypothetical protein [Nonomuraea soli]|uniref:Calcium-binding protein n=1 Tax=Nonomuraea soli TaxID=1032476 RepID=A0A7W0CND5_9ACTN|nr:hypothetical protein [Nonomuraea soli]MBA2894351.1 hypothetical protein [Nonomuraea soli]